jgi:hypothetical protein
MFLPHECCGVQLERELHTREVDERELDERELREEEAARYTAQTTLLIMKSKLLCETEGSVLTYKPLRFDLTSSFQPGCAHSHQ